MTRRQYEPEGFQTVEEPGEVIYTYDVEWKESEVTWAQRWDVYFTCVGVWALGSGLRVRVSGFTDWLTRLTQ